MFKSRGTWAVQNVQRRMKGDNLRHSFYGGWTHAEMPKAFLRRRLKITERYFILFLKWQWSSHSHSKGKGKRWQLHWHVRHASLLPLFLASPSILWLHDLKGMMSHLYRFNDTSCATGATFQQSAKATSSSFDIFCNLWTSKNINIHLTQASFTPTSRNHFTYFYLRPRPFSAPGLTLGAHSGRPPTWNFWTTGSNFPTSQHQWS